MRWTSAWALAGSPPSSPKIRRTGWPASPPRAATSAAQARAPWKNGAMVAPRMPLWTPNDPSRISPRAPAPACAAPGRGPAAGRAGPTAPPDAGVAASPPAAPAPPPEAAAGAAAEAVRPAAGDRADAGDGARPTGPAAVPTAAGTVVAVSAVAAGAAAGAADPVPGAPAPAAGSSRKGPLARARRSRPSRDPQAVPVTARQTATTRMVLGPRPAVPDILRNMSVCAGSCQSAGAGRVDASCFSGRDAGVALLKHKARTVSISRAAPGGPPSRLGDNARSDGAGLRSAVSPLPHCEAPAFRRGSRR